MTEKEVIEQLEKYSGLKFEYDYGQEAYRETTGAKHKVVLNAVIAYNDDHENMVTCYNDRNRDASYVQVAIIR